LDAALRENQILQVAIDLLERQEREELGNFGSSIPKA